MDHKKFKCLFPYFPSLVSGVLLTACFPDSGLYYLAFIAMVPLLFSIQSMTPKQSFYAGFMAGASHYLTLIYWLVPTVTIYGGLNWALGVATLVLLCLYLALYIGGFAWLIKRLTPPGWATPIVGAGIWVGLEYIRTHALTGFPWGILGYSQYLNQTLVQIADLTGVLGISFVIVLCNFALAHLFVHMSSPSDTQKKLRRETWVIISYTLVMVVAAGIYGRHQIQRLDAIIYKAPQPNICVAQGNINQDLKWDKAFKRATIEKYGSLSLGAIPQKPELIIWPETALPFYYGIDTVESNLVDEYIRKARTHFLVGSPAYERGRETIKYYNRAYMLNPLALVTGTYDKTHLVPFGEYVPLGEYLTFLGKITEQAGNFSRGDETFFPLSFRDHKTGVLICFEILFPSIAREFVKNGADLLTTITNDAWFGQTSAPGQHFAVAVLRAVENRRSVVRAANTGISGFIDPLGRVLEKTDLFETTAITKPVPALKEISFYTRHGELFVMVVLVAIFFGFMVKGINFFFRRRQK